MGSTIAEKILGAHAGGSPVKAEDVVVASVDFAMVHDARAANALKIIGKLGAGRDNYLSVVTGFDVVTFAFRDGQAPRSSAYSGRTIAFLDLLTPPKHRSCHSA